MSSTIEIPRLLKQLLSLKRPHGGVGEGIARDLVCDVLKGAGVFFTQDKTGNVIAEVGQDNGCVFTAHLDTVHRADGPLQLGYIDETGELVADDEHGKACVLGADDAAGVFLLTELIKHGVPGRYFFFIGEEMGGIGSSEFVRENPTFSANFVVSFDRKGKSDIITHQGCSRTASDEFAKALAVELYKKSGGNVRLRPCPDGVYTDSKEFSHIVPECTNISVGYWHEHTVQESLELGYLLDLRDAIVQVDWTKLPIIRTPTPDSFDWADVYGTKKHVHDDVDHLAELKVAHRWCRSRIEEDDLSIQDVEHLLDVLENFI